MDSNIFNTTVRSDEDDGAFHSVEEPKILALSRTYSSESVISGMRPHDFDDVDLSENDLCTPPEVDDEERIKGGASGRKVFKARLKTAFRIFQYIASTLLLLYSIVLVYSRIKSSHRHDISGIIVTCVVLCILFLWLGMLEGGLGALIGLISALASISDVNADIEGCRNTDITNENKNSLIPSRHKMTKMNLSVLERHENRMERFIIGRQFLAFLVVFLVNILVASFSGYNEEEDEDGKNHPNVLVKSLQEYNVDIALLIVMLGQLPAQLLSADCMLDILNSRAMLYAVIYLSLIVETSGLLHAVYLFKALFAKFCFYSKHSSLSLQTLSIEDRDVLTRISTKKILQRILYWFQILASTGIFLYAMIIILASMFVNSIPSGILNTIGFIALIVMVGILEGMQVAIFAIMKCSNETKENDIFEEYPMAKTNYAIIFKKEVNKMEEFLIGRQICVTVCMILIARMTSLDLVSESSNGFINDVKPKHKGFQHLLELTGIFGALCTTIAASLIWRVIATSFPAMFLSNRVIKYCIKLCLFIDFTGICSASRLITKGLKYKWHFADVVICVFQSDEVHWNGDIFVG